MNIEISDKNNNKILFDVKDILNSISKCINRGNYYVVDRFEENFAVLENLKSKKNINIPKDDIWGKISEGDVLKFQNGHFVIDNAQTKLRKDEILDITKDIFEND